MAARDRAGTYLNLGDVERGLVVVDRAIAAVQAAPLSTADRDLAVGILNLRGMTLAPTWMPSDVMIRYSNTPGGIRSVRTSLLTD
ncbi:hypothetical protein ACFU9Y_27065 [Streptomyces sp. NPDC057621]|uniref:hypothetical protein n=1 Tax=Streptomyces sp. NPDC057621 TaxID=3346186 RepID=UPI0036B7C0E0